MAYEAKKTLKKDWVLTSEAFNLLLSNLADNQEQSSKVYEEIRKRLIRQFRASQSLIPEEQADEVFNRVARKIYEDGLVLERETLFPYFHQTARYVLLEYQKQFKRRMLNFDDLSGAEEPYYDLQENLEKISEKINRELGLNALSECRRSLGTKDLELLDKYNAAQGKEKKALHENMARDLGKTQNALKIYITRLRKKLIDCAKSKLNL